VPLNSPRLLIRHWIPSTGYTQIKILSYKRSLHLARHRQPMQYKTTKYYKIRDNTTSTGDTSREDPNRPFTIGTRRHQPRPNVPILLINRRGPYPKVQPINSTRPIISLRSRHRHERSFNNFDIATYASILTLPLYNYSTSQFNPYLYFN
jgi:hypothetical protein